MFFSYSDVDRKKLRLLRWNIRTIGDSFPVSFSSILDSEPSIHAWRIQFTLGLSKLHSKSPDERFGDKTLSIELFLLRFLERWEEIYETCGWEFLVGLSKRQSICPAGISESKGFWEGNFLWKTNFFQQYWIWSEVIILMAKVLRGLSKLQFKCHEKTFEEKKSFLKEKICVSDFRTSSGKSPVCWRQFSDRVVRSTLNLSGQKFEEKIFFRKSYIFLTFFETWRK